MPLLWRYLLKNFLQVFLLALFGFVIMLLILKLQDIARFAALSHAYKPALLFILYQIPYILPLAIPISLALAAYAVCQKLSASHELTALRASGLSLAMIMTPLFLAAALFSVVTLAFTAQITPLSRYLSKELVYDMAKKSPLFLLQKESFIKFKNNHFEAKEIISHDEAKEVLFVLYNTSQQRLNVGSAKTLSMDNHNLYGQDVSMISYSDAKNEGFDHLVIENQKNMSMLEFELSSFFNMDEWRESIDFLSLHDLLFKKCAPHLDKDKIRMEIIRRLSLSLSPITFVFLALSFGIFIGRQQEKKTLIYALFLITFFLAAFMAAKSMKSNLITCLTCFLLPHLLLISISFKRLNKIVKGVDA